MMRPATCLAVVLLISLPARAQDQMKQDKPPERVTVTGTRAHKVIQDFVKTFAAPTRVAGKITRWEQGICPQTVGLNPAAVKFMNARLKAVAARAGAPVNDKPYCRVNIEIVFTTTPQAMIDNVRKEKPDLLGYADNKEKLDALATVTRPIQAWYMTQTRDVRGNVFTDVAHRYRRGQGLTWPCPPGPDCELPDAVVMKSTDSKLGDGLRSEFQHVIVAADPTKLTDYAMGQVADYIALVALAQVATPGACQPIASIVNLLAAGCDSNPDGLSDNDLAYLNGLYHMHATYDWRIQRNEIVSRIETQAAGQ
jgi:hypothetical protein